MKDSYLMQLTSEYFIDGTRMGNDSRFINHSCNPCAMMQTWSVLACFVCCLVSVPWAGLWMVSRALGCSRCVTCGLEQRSHSIISSSAWELKTPSDHSYVAMHLTVRV